MPTYVYRREESGTVFEIVQKMSDDPLEQCPDTGEPVHRIMQPPSVKFKGNGFYQTDYDGKNPSS